MLTCIAAVLFLVVHILYIYYAHTMRDAWFVIAVALAHVGLNIYACDYISAASAHTSKLPLREIIVLNVMLMSELSSNSSTEW